MNLFDVMERFPSHESCISLLEDVRWGEHPQCPYCESDKVARKKEGGKIGRWNCHSCKSSFNVLAGTLFQGTKIPLPKWFLAIVLMVTAEKNLSSYQLAEHLGLNQGSTLSMMQRINKEMARKEDAFLQGIIKADQIYVEGKPRRRKNGDGKLAPSSKHRRDTKKTPTSNKKQPDTQQLEILFYQN